MFCARPPQLAMTSMPIEFATHTSRFLTLFWWLRLLLCLVLPVDMAHDSAHRLGVLNTAQHSLEPGDRLGKAVL